MTTKLYINRNLTLKDVIKLYPSATVIDVEDLIQNVTIELEDYQKEITMNEARIEVLEDKLYSYKKMN